MFVLSKNKKADEPIAYNNSEKWYIDKIPYENHDKAIDEILELKSIKENLGSKFDDYEKTIIKDYLNERTIPKIRKYKTYISDMLYALDRCLNRSIDGQNFFRYPGDKIRDAINIYGISGSGKSYYAMQYCKRYRKIYPDRKIYLVTTNIHDDDLFRNLGIKKLSLSRDVIKKLKFDEKTFKNALVIFDDIESDDRAISEYVRRIRNMLFLKSRKHHTSILNIIHKALGGHDTVTCNNECTGGVFFIRHNWAESKRLLSKYFELNDSQLKMVYATKKSSRCVYVHKIFPKFLICDDKIQMLD